MKNPVSKLLIAIFLLMLCLPSEARVKVKVACIGDSITFGAGISDRDKDSYPSQLQTLLGPAYEVRNFGFSARVMSQSGDYPYMKEKMFEDVKAFLPDICVIMLGTNDTKPQNWAPDEFRASYEMMLGELRNLASHPDIFACYPPTVVTDRWGINEKLVVEGAMPIIDAVAEPRRIDVVDTHSATAGMPENYCDGVHPNASGAAVLAKTVYGALIRNGYKSEPGLRIMFVGDSITDGQWGNPSRSGRHFYDYNHLLGHGFPEMCAADWLGKHPERNYTFYNRGISGDTVKGMAARWDNDVLAVHPDIVSILVGINDVLESSVDNFDFAGWEATYRSLLDRTLAQNPEVRFVLCTPFATDRILDGDDPVYERRHQIVEKMSSIVKGMASDYACTIVDTFSLIDSLVAEDKADDHLYWMWDGVHPSTAGHRKIADIWLKSTRKLFR